MTDLPLVVLAGGFGTRLQSVVSNLPKALAPIAGRPFLDFLLYQWCAQGVTDFIFLLHYKADMIIAYLAQRALEPSFAGCRFRHVVETAPLGTGGAVANAIGALGLSGDILVANADTWLGSGIKELTSLRGPGIAIVQVADSSRYGRVETKANHVTGFAEKSAMGGSAWINAGLYKLNTLPFDKLKILPASLETSILPSLCASGELETAPLETDFIDIGVPADYGRFHEWVTTGKVSTSWTDRF